MNKEEDMMRTALRIRRSLTLSVGGLCLGVASAGFGFTSLLHLFQAAISNSHPTDKDVAVAFFCANLCFISLILILLGRKVR